jgi:hypothetical protein
MKILKNKDFEAIKRMLEYSFEPIQYQYSQLTKQEKSLISSYEFQRICKLIGKKPYLKNGDIIKIIYLPDNHGERNVYIGMKGEVRDLMGTRFNVWTGDAWLVGLDTETTKYQFIQSMSEI